MPRNTNTLLTLLAACCLLACSDPSATQAPSVSTEPPAPSQAVVSMKLPEAAIVTKSEVAIKLGKLTRSEFRCAKANNTIENAFVRYKDWVQDSVHGPTGKETAVHGIFEVPMDMVSACQEQLLATLPLPPNMPNLDQAAQGYIQALRKFALAVADIRPYYQTEGYKKDGWAKGKKAHAQLVSSFDEFDLTRGKYADQVEVLEHTLKQEQLTELQKLQGKNLVYWREAIAHDVQVIFFTMRASGFDPKNAQHLLSNLASTLNQAATRTKSHPEEVHPQWVLMMDAAHGFSQVAMELLRATTASTTEQASASQTESIGISQSKLNSMFVAVTVINHTLEE